MIVGEIRGGLGNQLFCYAMCRKLQKEYHEPAVGILWEESLRRTILDIKGAENLRFLNMKSSTAKTWTEKHPLIVRHPFLEIARVLNQHIVDHYAVMPKGYQQLKKRQEKWQGIFNFFGFYFSENGYVSVTFPHTPFRNKLFAGYFSSSKYFQDIRCELLNEIVPREAPSGPCEEMLEQIEREKNAICVHVRRGDFVTLSNIFGGICTEQYYESAVQYMKKRFADCHFYIFSNDMDWVKDNMNFPAESTTYVTVNREQDAVQELWLMANCSHFIIANSTFSWWAQFLGRSNEKCVCGPETFLKEDIPNDMREQTWIAISPTGEIISGKKGE